MTNEEIDAIVAKEKGTTDRWGSTDYEAANLKHVANTVNAIMQERLDRQSIEIAQKDAKIYAYEAIIANSNFKAVLPKKQESKK